MAQIIIPLPAAPANWRTTLFGIVTAGGAAAIEYLQSGGLSWKGCAMAAAWAGLCYLVPDAKDGATKQQMAGMVESMVVAKLAESTPDAPAPASAPAGKGL